jgi:LDH2 family malate/lactate/ureidoglycolate dehydrogenase
MGDDPDRLDYTKGAGETIRLGTNPLAISIPHTDGIVTFDTAWTRMAVSYCLKHLKSGKMMTLPEYIGDAEYKSTFDPRDFAVSMDDLKNITGTVFPHGSTLAGYKGDSMLRFIEMDNALGGGPITKIDLGSTDKTRWISHTFEAQAIDVLYSKRDAKKRIRSLMSDYEQNYFGKNSRWPGDRADMAEIYSESNGIPYDEGQIETLKRAAEHVNLEFDLPISQEKPFPEHLFNK